MSKIIYYCVLDFEATCWENENRDTLEIIEFPSVLIRVDTAEKTISKVSEFHRYVRPVLDPEVSEFCTNLTGITQSQVDASDIIENVYEEHYIWLTSQLVDEAASCYFVTCGNWDLKTMLPMEIMNKNLPIRDLYTKFINIKYEYERLYRQKVYGMTDMLSRSGLELEGKHHSGIDDTRNIARVLWKMIEDGYSKPRVQTVKHK
jgi:ERI1 exoribonuclease 3